MLERNVAEMFAAVHIPSSHGNTQWFHGCVLVHPFNNSLAIRHSTWATEEEGGSGEKPVEATYLTYQGVVVG